VTDICTKLHQMLHHAPDLGWQRRPTGTFPTVIRPRNVYQRPLRTRQRETHFPNRTQEADGSIPFISTILFDFLFWKVSLKRFAAQSFQTQEASRSPSKTPSTRRC
jgi:hypothetical protein